MKLHLIRHSTFMVDSRGVQKHSNCVLPLYCSPHPQWTTHSKMINISTTIMIFFFLFKSCNLKQFNLLKKFEDIKKDINSLRNIGMNDME